MPDWLPFRTRVSAIVVAPEELVFDYVANPERWDEWQLVPATTTRTSSGAWGVGATYEMAFRMAGRPQVLSCIVTRYDPPHTISYSANGSYLCDSVVSLQMSRSGVQVTMDARTGYRSWVKVTLGLIGWPLTMWWVRWRMHQQIKKFKRVVEDSLTQPGKR